MAEFLIIFLLLVFAAPTAYCVFGAIAAHLEAVEYGETTPCTPTRRANITASQPQAQRRVVLAPITADYVLPFPLPAGYVVPKPQHQPAGDYAVPRPCDVDAIRENSRTYSLDELAAPDPEPVEVHVSELMSILTGEELPLAVDDWPVVKVGDRTAARFEHLEIGGKR